jgi:hypothetical protein
MSAKIESLKVRSQGDIDELRAIVWRAIKMFGGQERLVFTTQCFIHAVKDRYDLVKFPSMEWATEVLASCLFVEAQNQNCTWRVKPKTVQMPG